MGLFEEGPDGIQRITNDGGLATAEAFRSAVGPAIEAAFIDAIVAGRIDRAALAALRPIVPSEIPDVSDEREIYEATLFAAGVRAMDADKSRRASLSLILGVAGRDLARPTPESVRWSLFDPPAGVLPAAFEGQRLLWEAYHCQDLFQVAAAGLLAWAISIMLESEDGRPLAEIQGAIEARLAEVDEDGARTGWSAYRDQIGVDAFEWRDRWDRLTGRRSSPEDKGWTAVKLIAALHRRLVVRDDLRHAMLTALPVNGQARSIVSELRWFDHHQDLPVAGLIGDYVARRIVLRHSWVAMQKLRRQRDYTFLFEARDGRLVCLNGYQPVPTTPRLAPAIQFLEDVHLVAADGLTERGRAMLDANR